MSFVTIFVGVIDLKMDITNFIKINSDLDSKEATTQGENGTIKVNHYFRVQQRKKSIQPQSSLQSSITE